MKDCISLTGSYLSHTLKLDNLPPICKTYSVQFLQRANGNIQAAR